MFTRFFHRKFYFYFIEAWRKKSTNTTCPICRADVVMMSPNQVLDGFIEKFIDNFFPEDAKKQRQELVKERKAKKDARAAAKDRDFPGAALINSVSRRRILNLDSDDDDSWDADGPDMEQHGILRGRYIIEVDRIREILLTNLRQRAQRRRNILL